MNATITDLLQLIGEQAVELVLLRRELQRLQQQLAEMEKAPGPGPRPVPLPAG